MQRGLLTHRKAASDTAENVTLKGKLTSLMPGTPTPTSRSRPALVTGATGYIGGRLVPCLLEAGYRVRCMARGPRKLAGRPWFSNPNVEIVAGDADDREALAAAMRGCGAAYYLIHSMMAVGPSYRARGRLLALAPYAGAGRGSLDSPRPARGTVGWGGRPRAG